MISLNNLFQSLTPNEAIFKSMYHKYPYLHLNQPHGLPELDAATKSLPEYQMINLTSPDEFPVSAVFSENSFKENTSVSIRFHERYSPCFYHEHDFFEIIYVLRGHCTNYIGNKEQHCTQGDIYIIAPHSPHAISVFEDDTLVLNILLRATTFQETFFYSLHDKGILTDFFTRALFSLDSLPHLCFHTGSDEKLFHLIDEIVEESTHGYRYADSICSSLVTLFFLNLLRNHEKNLEVPNPTGGRSEENIMFILNYIWWHYNEITLTDLAKFFNYSERQMTRLLKDYTGQSFTAIVRDIRLEKCCELLKTTEIPIPEIITSIGYTNATHFYKLFRNKYGVTPAAYREKHR